jgi:hypothetical protein
MFEIPKILKDLCSPAIVYFAISIASLIIILFQNVGNKNSYNVGNFSCRVPNTSIVFFVKFIYIIFWTYILNLICKDGHNGLSWLLVLLPWILLFVIIGMVMINV